jgi:hypothetical protein
MKKNKNLKNKNKIDTVSDGKGLDQLASQEEWKKCNREEE